MATFQYEALNQAGQQQKGVIEAGNSEDAISRIKSQGLFPTNVREKKVRKRGASAGAGGVTRKKTEITINIGRVKTKLLTQFSRQMSTLQDAGLPILRSLQILAEQQKPGQFKNILEQVAVDVEGGLSLSEAMAKHPRAFERLYCKMIAAGEVGGVLDLVMQRLADFMEKAEKLKKKIIAAMIYPAAVISIAVLIVVGIMIVVVPQFETIFADFDSELPWLTQQMISTSKWMGWGNEGQAVPGFVWVIGVPIGLVFFFKLIRKNKGGKAVMDYMFIMVPVLGRLIKAGSIAKFTRTLGTLLSAGVPILEALIITRDTVGNHIYEKALQKVHDAIRDGESFAVPLRESRVCDLLVVNMVDVGEETGELDKMLSKVADNYDEEVDNLVAALMSLLEPIMVVTLGLIVGTLVVAMFIPLPALIEGVMK